MDDKMENERNLEHKVVIIEHSSRLSLVSAVDENFETFSLIWLDQAANELHDNHDIQQQLRSIINYLKIFQDFTDCDPYIQASSKDDRLIILVHEQYALKLVASVNNLRQVVAIYIHSTDNDQNFEWITQYKKVKAVKADIEELINQIKTDHAKQKKLEEPLSINIYNKSQPIDHLSSNCNSEFLYCQLLIYFLFHIKLNNEQIGENTQELVDLCKTVYQDSSNQLKTLHEFKHSYVSSNALWWYTFDSFLFRLLNKSLHAINIDLLYSLQFFIHDLIRQLKKDQTSNIDHVYRGYLLSNEEFDLMTSSIGEYISIVTFFSTYLNRKDALSYLNDYDCDTNLMKKVLFCIDVDSRLSKVKPYANISIHSQTTNEEEILFSLGSIFYIDSIQKCKTDIYTIHLKLCGDDDYHLKPVFDFIKHQFNEHDVSLLSLGNALKRTGKLDEAEKCFQRLLNDPTNNQAFRSRSYHYLGRIAETKGDYETSLECLQKSLDIKLKITKPNDPTIAQSYNRIGIVYQQKGDHEKALEAFNKALTIWRRAYGKNHPNVAGCYNNMGVVYKKEKKYVEALESFLIALDIRERCPSVHHYDLAGSHNNIGAVYERLGLHELAIEHYNLSLKIKSKSLPTHHLSMASTLENMGYVYENKGAYLQALTYLEKASTIYHHSLPSTHHDVIQIEESIQRVSSKMS